MFGLIAFLAYLNDFKIIIERKKRQRFLRPNTVIARLGSGDRSEVIR
jgi:hypothetical protein